MRSTAADPESSDPDLVVSVYWSWFLGVLPYLYCWYIGLSGRSVHLEAVCKWSCSANDLVLRRIGVFCTVFTPVYWGNLYILRRHARKSKSVNTGAEASRATKFTYLHSCSANELVHRRLGVFCTVFTSVSWEKWYILRRHARGSKA